MKVKLFKIFFFLFFVFLPVCTFAKPEKFSSCEKCHSKNKVNFHKSVHNQKLGLTCVSCHGGNDQDIKITAMDISAGFKGKFNKKQTINLCGSCHSDRKKMAAYGLPTDQVSTYFTSQHGQLLQKGNNDVAVCTDCHSSHKILKVKDGESTVYKTNIPDTCGKCHSNKKLMSKYNIPTDQLDKYKQSVHGQSLLLGGNMGAANCTSCHGYHGATPPNVKDIEHVCAQCHGTTFDAFVTSPHQMAVDNKKMTPCTSCHSNHKILKPEIGLIPNICLKCHNKNSSAVLSGKEIKGIITSTESKLENAKKQIEKYQHIILETEDIMGRIDETKTNLLQIAVVQHSLNKREVEKKAVAVEAVADDALLFFKDYAQRLKVRKVAVVIIWLIVFWNIFLVYLKRRKSIKEQERQGIFY